MDIHANFLITFAIYFTVNAEKLFDMPLTDYTEFLHAKKDFENLRMVIDFFLWQTKLFQFVLEKHIKLSYQMTNAPCKF